MIDVKTVQNDEARLRTFWEPRGRRIIEWWDLERLEQPERSYQDYDRDVVSPREHLVTNDPATLMSMSIHLLSSAQPLHRVVVGEAGEAEQRRAGKTERLVRAKWREVDDMEFQGGRDEWLRSLAYWMCSSGWFATVAACVEDSDGNPCWIADLHNPLEAFQEYGRDGLVNYVHSYHTTLEDARSKAGYLGSNANLRGDGTQAVKIIDHWHWDEKNEESINSVLLMGSSGRTWLKEPERFGDYMPVISGPVGGRPDRGARGLMDDTWKRDAGMSILEKNRKVYKEFNRFFSLLMQVAKDHAEPPWLAKGTGMLVKPEDVGTGGLWTPGGKVISTPNPNASLTRVDPGKSPIEVQSFMSILDGMMQRGGFPYLFYGGMAQELSGFAINQLLNAAMHQLGPYQRAMQRVIRFVDKCWLEDYRRLFPEHTVDVASRSTEGGRRIGYSMEKYNPKSDMPKHIYVEVEQSLSLPRDILERMTILRQAIPNGPVLDLLTGLDEILQVEDPYLVMSRLGQDALRVNPVTMQLELVMELRKKAKELNDIGGPENRETADLLEGFATHLSTQFQQINAQGAQDQGNGISPGAMPPEAQGISPDMKRSMLRQAPGTPNKTRQQQLAERGVIG